MYLENLKSVPSTVASCRGERDHGHISMLMNKIRYTYLKKKRMNQWKSRITVISMIELVGSRIRNATMRLELKISLTRRFNFSCSMMIHFIKFFHLGRGGQWELEDPKEIKYLLSETAVGYYQYELLERIVPRW